MRQLLFKFYYTRYQSRFTCGESNLYWNSKWPNYDNQHCSPETLLKKGLFCGSFAPKFAKILRADVYRIFCFIHVNGCFYSFIVWYSIHFRIMKTGMKIAFLDHCGSRKGPWNRTCSFFRLDVFLELDH